MNLVEVALPTPLRSTFTYQHNLQESLIGKRVIVDFGRRKLVGIVIKNNHQKKVKFKVKYISKVLDESPVFNAQQLDKILEISDIYQHPVGEVAALFLPNMLRKNTTTESLRKYQEQVLSKKKLGELSILTDQQTQCLKNILAEKKNKILLFGVTSSGKTEIYKHLVREYFMNGQSSLVLVPEIFLTPQLYESFVKVFGDHVLLYHSSLTELQKYKVFLKAKLKGPKIIIGTRSSVFLPVKNLGLIIFDEEHDQSFKQQDGVRYDAKKVAQVLNENAKVVFASATPSLSNLRDVESSKTSVFYLSQRYGEFSKPKISLIDISKKKLQKGLHPEVYEKITKTLNDGKQALILLNRRGYAPIYFCNSCGWVVKSNCCDAPLVYHRFDQRLRCHRCGSAWSLPRECRSCGANDFDSKGIGTQQLEEVLQEKFSDYQVVRVDRDSVSSKSKRSTTSELIKESKPMIFVGTQLLAKGHDFRNLSLIVILNLDFGLFGADVHLQEQTAQLLIQVAGRAGRKQEGSEVVLQSRLVDHPLLKVLQNGDFSAVAQSLLKERKMLKLYPYLNMVYFKAEDTNQDRLNKFLLEIKKKFSVDGVEIYGPFENPVPKKNYKYRMFCIIQSDNDSILNAKVRSVVKELAKDSRKIASWALDFDPINVT